MIKAFINLFKWPWVRMKKDPSKPLGLDEIPYEGFLPPKKEPRHWSCNILDTADRAVALFGAPAKRLYIETCEWSEYLKRSVKRKLKPIYHNRYTRRCWANWLHLDDEMGDKLGTTTPGPPVWTPPQIVIEPPIEVPGYVKEAE